MSTKVALSARLEQCFERRVQLSTHWLRLRPAPHAQGIEAYSLKVEGGPHFVNWLRDPYENHLARLDLPEPVPELGLELDLVAGIEPRNPFDFLTEPFAANFPFDYPEQLRKELKPYLRVDEAGPRLADWFKGLNRKPQYIVDKLGQIAESLSQRMPSLGVASTPGWVDVEGLLARGSGSPWETAWLLTLSLRAMGIAARFSSGFRIWLSETSDTPDTASAHAWSEAFLPGAGWVGLDPQSGLFTAEGYIPLAAAPDPLRTVPVTGFFEACGEESSLSLTLRRLTESPDVDGLSDPAWADVRAVGARVDADLAAADLKLTIGSGLSFVSARNPGLLEWSTTAVGFDKRQVAEWLLPAIASHCGSGGVMQQGQGEWYSGEDFPRWRLSYFARSDGLPLWKNPDRLAWRRRSPVNVTNDDVRHFAEALARALGISPEFVIPAHEDGLHQLWANRLGADWIPSPDDLRDPDRRRGVAACLSSGHGQPAGFVIPLRWDPIEDRWASGAWTFRRKGLYLIPGSSPLGYRLPIESLPIGEGGVLDSDPERCQTEDRPVLPAVCGELSARYSTVEPPDDTMQDADGPAAALDRPPRTALALQFRDGQLYVFLPPLTHLEHYLELVAAVEAAANELGMAVLLEGYDPPEDFRLRRLVVEPDAGCLKVWLPALAGWSAQSDLVAAAYAEAARIGLRAERLVGEGRRAPPGGGAEVVLGGETPSESPFLRRPELLRALITYWQRHPSLSYLFAGRMIGPDGPAPRPDEGRDDALYELRLALSRIPPGLCALPWIPDRLLRHLLVDPAGNMKRAEIRVDLLYSPDRPSLRLGKLIVRSFEAAADARLTSLLSLLSAALMAKFARDTDVGELVDWGHALHEQLMLPQVLWQDFETVLADLEKAGYPLQPAWFKPIIDVRFPVLGSVRIGDIGLELRAAHEPWPLMAEEVAGGGVTRFVDAANERVQLRCRGLTPGRYAVSCNGFDVPLRGTGVKGEYLAGIRFKVWNPPSTLHPTVFPVGSLVVDLIDLWTQRVVGGFTYYPPRPGVWGMSGVPSSVPAPPEGMPRRDQRRLPLISMPPWSSGGKFLPFGSVTEAPPKRVEQPGLTTPYMLDLTHLV